MRIGFYGGAFDPFHNGHLSIISGALKSKRVDIVIVIPSVLSPFKKGTEISAAPYRYYMTADAIKSLPSDESYKVFISDAEFYMNEVCYTAKLLKQFTSKDYITAFLENRGFLKKQATEKHDYFWLCGSDILNDFDRWFQCESILTMVTLMVAHRPSNVDAERSFKQQTDLFEKKFNTKLEIFNIDGIKVASSEIRQTRDFRCVPEPVKKFIKTNNLYPVDNPLTFASTKAKNDFYRYSSILFPVLSRKRLLHSLNVSLLSAKYALIYGEDVDRALIAGVLHDCAKELSDVEQQQLAIKASGDAFDDKKLWHSPAGSVIANREFGITDSRILDAIMYHTTGREGMSTLEKIVFLADKLEPSRTYSDLKKIRETALIDLDKAVYMCMTEVRNKFVEQGREVHPYTKACLEELADK